MTVSVSPALAQRGATTAPPGEGSSDSSDEDDYARATARAGWTYHDAFGGPSKFSASTSHSVPTTGSYEATYKSGFHRGYGGNFAGSTTTQESGTLDVGECLRVFASTDSDLGASDTDTKTLCHHSSAMSLL